MVKDWEVEIAYKNLPTYRIPYYSLDYTIAASKPGLFSLNVPLNAETMDILRGSEISYLFKGEKVFSGKILNKKPNFGTKLLTLTGLDWNGILFDRQIAFQGYDSSTYSYAGADTWQWSGATPPGQNIEIESSALIKLILKHYTGENISDYGFGLDNIEGTLTKKMWRFEGETMGNSFTKIASMSQASSLRFGYHWWINAHKDYWMRRYGDTIYRKELAAEWGPPEEEISSIVNEVVLIGGIATPFPHDREALTNISGFAGTTSLTATNNTGLYHKPPTAASKGWGCWIRAEDYPTDGDTINLECDSDLGSVAGDQENAIHFLVTRSGNVKDTQFGIYYKIDDISSDFKDSLWPESDLRNWSNRAQLSSQMGHNIRTITFYMRQTEFPTTASGRKNMCGAMLKIYTNAAAPPMEQGGPTDLPDLHGSSTQYWRETENGVYSIDLLGLFEWYAGAYKEFAEAGEGYDPEQVPWIRVSIIFEPSVNYETFGAHDMGACVTGGAGGGIRFKIISQSAGAGGVDITAEWDVSSDKTLPDPEDIWGFGFEFNADLETGDSIEIGIDHLFVGFGEVEVRRRDNTSIAMLDREVTKWIQDRNCHSWNRAVLLADVLLDSLKYAQKSRKGTLNYFNPELRLNQLIPLNEWGVEWHYVLEQMSVSVSNQGVKQTLSVGTPKPDPDELMEFFNLNVVSMQAAGSGKTVHDWVANTKCFTRCEMFCEFACLSDWNTNFKRGGRVCQTSREKSCASCESVQELNPCTVACMRYSQIASIAQRPPAERSDIENTLLSGGPKVRAVVPEKGKAVTRAKKPREYPCVRTREYF